VRDVDALATCQAWQRRAREAYDNEEYEKAAAAAAIATSWAEKAKALTARGGVSWTA
jgi:hypothetical protein